MAIGASIGERLAHLINRKGLSDSDLAKVLHINRSTLSRIINGGTEKVSAQLIVDAAFRSIYRLSSGSDGYAGSHEPSDGRIQTDRGRSESNSI